MLPFLAPIMMQIGWEKPANLIYLFYSFVCHQLPQRSFFLLGEQASYSLKEIQTIWHTTADPFILRQFIGSPEMGWKVAWSDRMVTLYGSIFPFAWLWYPFRKKIKRLPLWGFLLLILPIVVDGGTHMISDFSGIGQGFRDTNQWLVALTNGELPWSFYAGDAIGSFNSWMRLITGTLFGLAVVWFTAPLFSRNIPELGPATAPIPDRDRNSKPIRRSQL